MKIRVIDRILVGLAGLVLIALAGAVVAELFFAVPVTTMLTDALAVQTTQNIAIVAGIAAVVLLMGIFCLCMLFRHNRGRRAVSCSHATAGP